MDPSTPTPLLFLDSRICPPTRLSSGNLDGQTLFFSSQENRGQMVLKVFLSEITSFPLFINSLIFKLWQLWV